MVLPEDHPYQGVTLLIKQIQPLSEEQLEALGKALLDFSEIAQLETWLRNISQTARDQQSTS